MATLTVTVSRNYFTVLPPAPGVGDQYVLVTFATAGPTFATFDSSQFGSGQFFSDFLSVSGDANSNTVEVNLTSDHTFSAADWSFSNWTPGAGSTEDRVRILGSDSGDHITGSTMDDVITGGLGADTLIGGDGNDSFFYQSTAQLANGESLDGGLGTLDAIKVEPGNLSLNFTNIALQGIEKIELQNSGGAAEFSASQIGTGKISIVQGDALPSTVQTLRVGGQVINASALTFINWGAEDLVFLDGAVNLANTITGSSAADMIAGGNLNDSLAGGGGDDRLLGGTGNDTLDGGTSGTLGDTIDYSFESQQVTVWLDAAIHLAAGAGIGTDTVLNIENLVLGAGGDLVYSDANANNLTLRGGNDAVIDAGGNDTIDAGTGADTAFAGDGNDSVLGGADADIIAGGIGGDTIDAGAGLDFVLAEDGADSVSGGDDRDLLYGQAGNDTLRGDAGDDFMSGGDNNDLFHGGTGLDVVFGDAGDDTAYGEEDRDWVYGFSGNDTLYGGAGDDVIGGSDGFDNLNGDGGADALFGEADADTINGGADNDYVVGGAGANTISLGSGLDIVQSTLGEGGVQTVSDFGIADFDQVWLVNWGFANTAEALAACQQVGANVVLQNGADQVVLQNITLSQLQTYNFVLF